MERVFVLISLVSVLALVAFATSVSAQTDPASVLQHFQAARNAGDLDGAMALVAEDISYVGGPACPVEHPCAGLEAMRGNVERYIAGHEQATIVGAPAASETLLTARLESRSPERLAVGIERTLSDVTVQVRDGQLTSWGGTSDASDPQTAAWLALQRAPQPPLLIPADADENLTTR